MMGTGAWINTNLNVARRANYFNFVQLFCFLTANQLFNDIFKYFRYRYIVLELFCLTQCFSFVFIWSPISTKTLQEILLWDKGLHILSFHQMMQCTLDITAGTVKEHLAANYYQMALSNKTDCLNFNLHLSLRN